MAKVWGQSMFVGLTCPEPWTLNTIIEDAQPLNLGVASVRQMLDSIFGGRPSWQDGFWGSYSGTGIVGDTT